jgi:hypothetical protein
VFAIQNKLFMLRICSIAHPDNWRLLCPPFWLVNKGAARLMFYRPFRGIIDGFVSLDSSALFSMGNLAPMTKPGEGLQNAKCRSLSEAEGRAVRPFGVSAFHQPFTPVGLSSWLTFTVVTARQNSRLSEPLVHDSAT